MRVEKSLRNIAIAFIFQFLGIFISFFSRQYFVFFLGMDYLGLNGLFGNILSMISLAELGFSTAIMYLLFKPIAQNDLYKIKVLMKYLRKVYILIGLTIFLIGILIIPFLKIFINLDYNFNKIIGYYLIYLISTCSTYLFSYKSALIIAYQDKYISIIITYTIFIALNICQIAALAITKSYLIFLILMLIFNVLEGIFINFITNKKYSFMKEPINDSINKSEKFEIIKNVKALFIHRIGGAVINGTDNLIISTIIGIAAVGYYSNYYLIVNALNIIIGQIFAGITASVGNLGASGNKERLYEVYCIGLFINAFIYYGCTIILWFLIDDFISIWLGIGYIMKKNIVLIILANFHINGMRRITIVYRDSLGLYWYDRHKPVIEASINLVASILLANAFGIIGVFIGTFISLITTSFWVEPYILYKYGFNVKLKKYFYKYIKYIFIGALGFFSILFLDDLIHFKLTFFTLILKGILFLILFTFIFIIGTFKSFEFAEIKIILTRIYNNVLKGERLCFLSKR